MSEPQKRFKPLELVVAIFVFSALLGLLLPTNCAGVSPHATTIKALSNAKQIGLACQIYAEDHDGQYPGGAVMDGTTSSAEISGYSNTAFDLLFPVYLTSVQMFYQSNSAWTPSPITDPSTSQMQAGSLPAGYNEWAYVVGLNKSMPGYPMIADGFTNLKTHSYTTIETERGGVWKGANAIVVFSDVSAKVAKCNPTTHVIPGSPNGIDLFDTTGQPGWMNSAGPNGQHVLNPK